MDIAGIVLWAAGGVSIGLSVHCIMSWVRPCARGGGLLAVLAALSASFIAGIVSLGAGPVVAGLHIISAAVAAVLAAALGEVALRGLENVLVSLSSQPGGEPGMETTEEGSP